MARPFEARYAEWSCRVDAVDHVGARKAAHAEAKRDLGSAAPPMAKLSVRVLRPAKTGRKRSRRRRVGGVARPPAGADRYCRLGDHFRPWTEAEFRHRIRKPRVINGVLSRPYHEWSTSCRVCELVEAKRRRRLDYPRDSRRSPLRSATLDGAKARAAGEPRDACPWPRVAGWKSTWRAAWLAGWDGTDG